MSRFRQSLFYPILIAVLAIVFSIAVLVGWSVIFTQYYLLATQTQAFPQLGVGYWLTLSAGCVFLVAVIGTLAVFLTTNIRQTLYIQRQDSFIDSVTHELKSPLASLRLCLETMELRQLEPKMQARFVGMMKRDVDRLQVFIEHVLETGRLEHNERAVQVEPTVLPELFDQVFKQIHRRHTLAPKVLQMSMALEAPERPLMTDPVALELILINLIDNAIKYSDHDRLEVQITVVAEDDWVVVKVRDRGIGIDPRNLKRIFRRFIRLEREDKHHIQGTGLGLYVVASLVKRLGGRVEAHSDGQNKGSTFTLRLPDRREPPPTLEPTRRRKHERPAAAAGRG